MADEMRIQTNDGGWVYLPVDTPPDVIKATMAKVNGGAAAPATPDAPAPRGMEDPGMKAEMGILKQTGASTLHGLAGLVGLPGTIADWANNKFFKIDPEVQKKIDAQMANSPASQAIASVIGQPGQNPLSGERLQKGMSAITGGYSDRQPTNTAERYAQTFGEMLPAAAATGGLSSPLNFYRMAAMPAALSEGAGQLVENYGPKERPDWMPDWVPSLDTVARVGGALFGQPLATGTVKAVTPNATTVARQWAAREFDARNIPYTAGDKTGSTALRLRESELGGPAAIDANLAKKNAFNREVLGHVGVNPEDAVNQSVDDNLHAAGDRMGREFDDLASRNHIYPALPPQTSGWNHALDTIADDYMNNTAHTGRVPAVQNFVNDLKNDAQLGMIPGTKYQDYVTKLREAAKGQDYQTTSALNRIRNFIDNQMEASIQRFGSPEDLGRWRPLRAQYRDHIAIQNAAADAASKEGFINPNALARELRTQGGNRAFVTGGRSLTDLAKAGRLMIQDLPNSYTTPRLLAHLPGLTAGGGGIGGGIGFALGGPVGAGIGTAIGAGIPLAKAGFDKLVMSPPMQEYLGNQVLSNVIRRQIQNVREPPNLAGMSTTTRVGTTGLVPRAAVINPHIARVISKNIPSTSVRQGLVRFMLQQGGR